MRAASLEERLRYIYPLMEWYLSKLKFSRLPTLLLFSKDASFVSSPSMLQCSQTQAKFEFYIKFKLLWAGPRPFCPYVIVGEDPDYDRKNRWGRTREDQEHVWRLLNADDRQQRRRIVGETKTISDLCGYRNKSK